MEILANTHMESNGHCTEEEIIFVTVFAGVDDIVFALLMRRGVRRKTGCRFSESSVRASDI